MSSLEVDQQRLEMVNSSVFARLADAILLVTLQEPPRVLFVNEALVRLTGLSRQALVGQNLTVLCRDGVPFWGTLVAEVTCGRAFRTYLPIEQAAGTPLRVQLFASGLPEVSSQLLIILRPLSAELPPAGLGDLQVQAALLEISEAAHDAADLLKFFRTIHGILAGLMPAKNIYIALYDAKTSIIRFPYFVDTYDDAPPARTFRGGLTEYALQQGRVVLLSTDDIREILEQGVARSIGALPSAWLAAPLRARGETIGLLVLQSYDPQVRYSERHKALLAFVAQQVAVAIERKQDDLHLEQVARFRSELLDLINEGFEKEGARGDIGTPFYERVLEGAVRTIPGAEGGSLVIKEPDGHYHFVAAIGFDLERLNEASIDPHESSWNRGSFRPQVLFDLMRQGDYGDEFGDLLLRAITERDNEDVMVTPIHLEGTIVAFLFLHNFSAPHAFTSVSSDLAQTFAVQVAVLVKRLRLERELREGQAALAHANTELRRLATHDPLTGLPNRLLFRDRLAQALVRAKRQETLVAVCFLDLDGFKAVNDALGHAAGDELLKRVTERVQSLTRAGDTVARMGGDEFTLILNDLSTPQGALRVIEKLIEALRQPFPFETQAVRVGVSVGLALFPLHATDADTLLKLADTAMYRAKGSGTNRYVLYDPEEA